MEIKEHKSRLIVRNSKNNLDKQLDPILAPELPNYNGFCWVIVGSSGSGKTTLLYSLMKGRKSKGVRHGYNKVFDKIYVVSPTIGNESIKNDPFKALPEDQIYRELTLDNLDEIQENLEQNRSDEINSVLILDDVGSELKKSKAIEKKLISIIQNRRHLYTSIFILLQKFRDAPTGIRNNMSHFTSFRPKNMIERESIINEMFNFNKEQSNALMEYVFNDKHDFLFVDLSLRNSGQYQFYKNFNLLEIKK
jgi:GTPase SAR1 family protein